MRVVYVTSLSLLACSAWLVFNPDLFTVDPRRFGVGDVARFGRVLFQILAPVQLALAVFFSALFAASAVAREKDRRTLVLLLLTELTNSELVLGKLFASLLTVLVLLVAALPLFMFSVLFGGISFSQVGWVWTITVVAALAAGSLGSTIALWREKTFQTLALTTMFLAAWIGFWEIAADGVFGTRWWHWPSHQWAVAASPLRALLAAARPEAGIAGPSSNPTADSVAAFLVFAGTATLLLNLVAVLRVRVWNPSRELLPQSADDRQRETIWSDAQEVSIAGRMRIARVAGNVQRSPGRSRRVWDNPVLWREVCSWALGRKIVLIRIAYWLLFAAAAAGTYLIESAAAVDARGRLALPLVPLLVLSLMLVAALSVTSITGERDGRSLDLLLVTDLTPKEIVFGKLFGSLYNTKEIVLLPAILVVGLGMAGAIGWENVVYLLAGWGIMTLFVAMLGIHCGMMYANSQTAISVSLGTLFFLLVGIGICIALMVALGDPYGASFQVQYWPFVGIMAPGSLGLYLALGAGRPSRAIAVTAVVCPAATFWAITSYFLGFTLAILLVTGAAYGFATITMMIPAIHEFDVTTGRTTTEP